MRRYDVGLDAISRGRGDRHLEVRLSSVLRYHAELLKTVDGRGCEGFSVDETLVIGLLGLGNVRFGISDSFGASRQRRFPTLINL